ncbi:hypothetical protein JKP88DRAFT_352096 [Tribonema minus]|uniref:SGTA homodimerisation domain-containing protein n=1 Tax=Tribonema minus TaxID=303371 RepID=A0A835ZH25_9STRA|nr:hypothetical protein JKP88DRAFT_352096 [Tribonema minus]
MAADPKAIAFAVVQYLEGLAGSSDGAVDDVSQLTAAATALKAAFGVDTADAAQAKELSYEPATLDSIFAAGVKATGAVTALQEREAMMQNPLFKKFVGVISAKAPLAAEGTPEYDVQMNKIIATFKTKFGNKEEEEEEEEADEEEEEEAEDEVDPEAEAKAEAAKAEGNEYIKTQAFRKAEAAYSRALDLSPTGPNSHIYHCNRAAARCFLNDWDAAVEDCLASIDLSPAYIKAYARLGYAYYNMEDWEAAVKAYTKAIELEPNNTANKESLKKAEAKLKAVRSASSSVARGAPAAGGAGGMDMSALAGMLGGAGGGEGGLAGLLNNPAIMKMAQDPAVMKMAQGMMSNPAMMAQMQQMMGGGGGGMPDMSALAGMMGGAGGAPGGMPPPPASGSRGAGIQDDPEMMELQELMQREGPMAAMQKVGNNPRLQAKIMEMMQKGGMGGMS